MLTPASVISYIPPLNKKYTNVAIPKARNKTENNNNDIEFLRFKTSTKLLSSSCVLSLSTTPWYKSADFSKNINRIVNVKSPKNPITEKVIPTHTSNEV